MGKTTTTFSGPVVVGNTRVTMAGPGVVPFQFHVARGASVLSIVDGSFSFLAAVLLIVAGSLMLRDSLVAERLHRIYVVVKLPLIVVGAFATWWTFTSLMSGMMQGANGASTASFTRTMGLVEAIFWAGISLIYPVALLIVLSTRTAKGWLRRGAGGSGETK